MIIPHLDDLKPRTSKYLCSRLGIDDKGTRWLKAHKVPIVRYQKNPKGRRSPLIFRRKLIAAVRRSQDGWPAWKPFEFECRVHDIDPSRALSLIVLGCAPDHEFLKAVLNLCLDPESNLLLWLAGSPQDNPDYTNHALETWLGNEFAKRTAGSHPYIPDFAATYNTLVKTYPKKSFSSVWRKMKQLVKTWPRAADEINYNVFDGAILLGEPVSTDAGAETQNFMARCPSYLKQFIDARRAIDERVAALEPPVPEGSSKEVWNNLMSQMEPVKMGGIIVPTWVLGKASRFNLNRHILSISGIENCLKHGAAVDFMGQRMTYFHWSAEEFKSVAEHLQKSAAASEVILPLKEAMDIIRLWNYRANHDQERPKRPLKRVGFSAVSVASAARGIATLPPSVKLNSLELRRIFGGITTERLRKDLAITRKKTKSSA